MKDNQRQILELLSTAMLNEHCTWLDEAQWKEIQPQLQKQAVDILPAEIIQQSQISGESKQSHALSVGKSLQNFYHLLEEQKQLIQKIEEHGHRVAIIKGTAAAYYYPHPEYRRMGDIDYLVEEKDDDEIIHMLLEAGYQVRDKGYVKKYDLPLIHNGVILEQHTRPAGVDEDNVIVRSIIKEGFDHLTHIDIMGYDVPVLPRVQNGLVLLYHIAHHLPVGIGYRQIFDWMMFAKAEIADDVWETDFQPVLKQVRLEKLAKTVTKMCVMFFGIPDEITWCMDADTQDCIQLFEYIQSQGNLGKAAPRHFGAESLATLYRDGFFRVMNSNGEVHWREKHPNNSPERIMGLAKVLWVYQGVRYLKEGLTAGGFRYLAESAQEGRKRKHLLKKLGL